MVVIRLSRGGSNKRPFYKVVASDRRAARDGGYLEQLGYFNPIATGGEKRLELNKERVDYWLGQGAQTSDRVAILLREFASPAIVEKRKEKNEAKKALKKEQAKLAAKAAAEKENKGEEESKKEEASE